jgi:hypothetical protein
MNGPAGQGLPDGVAHDGNDPAPPEAGLAPKASPSPEDGGRVAGAGRSVMEVASPDVHPSMARTSVSISTSKPSLDLWGTEPEPKPEPEPGVEVEAKPAGGMEDIWL